MIILYAYTNICLNKQERVHLFRHAKGAFKYAYTISFQVKFSADKVRLEPELAKQLFTKPVDHVKGHLQRLLQEPTTNGTEVIIMVGGFSDSPMLHQPIKERYPGINVIKPEEAVLAVLKGAVMFGRIPQ